MLVYADQGIISKDEGANKVVRRKLALEEGCAWMRRAYREVQHILNATRAARATALRLTNFGKLN
jgi:hypothetical protein